MKQTKTNTAAIIAFAMASIVLFCIIAHAQQENVGEKYALFSKWGLSFEYPAEWHEHPADRVAMMKEFLATELRPHGRALEEFAMIVGPNDEAALLITKYTTPKAMKPSEFIEERKQVYEEAKRAGDVTKVNHVKETIISKLPAVEEDVERSNGGRGRTYKLISGKTIFELSFVVSAGRKFGSYSDELTQIISTLSIVEK